VQVVDSRIDGLRRLWRTPRPVRAAEASHRREL